jgi:hypothetical protein
VRIVGRAELRRYAGLVGAPALSVVNVGGVLPRSARTRRRPSIVRAGASDDQCSQVSRRYRKLDVLLALAAPR